MNIRIHINKLGPIGDSEIELKPLMVFTGMSGLGKSYTAFLIYYLVNSINFVDKHETGVIEPASHFVDKPCQGKPPKQCTTENGHKGQQHFERPMGNGERKLRVCRHKQEDDKWIGKSNEKGCNAVVPISAFPFIGMAEMAFRLWAETINAEEQQYCAADDLKPELVWWVGDKVHGKTHAQTCNQRIDDVAARSANASN